MPVWLIASVAAQPAFVLVSWAVYEVQLQQDGKVTRHLAGEVGYGGSGQVSSAIVTFDARMAAFRTRSGRVYRVRGADGLGKEADYVWQVWRSHNPSHIPIRDATEEVKLAIAQANGFDNYKDLRRALLNARDAGDELSHML